MIGVGTCSRVARPRVSGAMKTRFLASIAPMRIGSDREGMQDAHVVSRTNGRHAAFAAHHADFIRVLQVARPGRMRSPGPRCPTAGTHTARWRWQSLHSAPVEPEHEHCRSSSRSLGAGTRKADSTIINTTFTKHQNSSVPPTERNVAPIHKVGSSTLFQLEPVIVHDPAVPRSPLQDSIHTPTRRVPLRPRRPAPVVPRTRSGDRDVAYGRE